MREGAQSGLFVWYLIASVIVLVLLPGDLASDLIVVSATGILMIATIIVRLLCRRRRNRGETTTGGPQLLAEPIDTHLVARLDL